MGARLIRGDGQFTLDANNQIVTPSGYHLVWDGEIPEDATQIAVAKDGTVSVLQGDTWNQVGQIQVNRFPNTNGLESYGQNLWLETEVSGAAETGVAGTETYGTIISSALEMSNVNIANEMTQIITLQRSFEMSLRTFQQTDLMLSQAINMRQ